MPRLDACSRRVVRPALVMTRLLLLGALFSALFGCNAEGDPQDSVDLSEVPFLAPWGAGAVVKIDKTYYFPSEFDPDFDEPLKGLRLPSIVRE